MSSILKVDEVYHWRGQGDGGGQFPSCCRVRIFWPHPEQPVVVLSNDDTGASITNSVQYILLPIARRYRLDPAQTVWIEHYPKYRQSDPEAEFSQVLPAIADKRVTVGWKSLSRADAEAIISTQIDD